MTLSLVIGSKNSDDVLSQLRLISKRQITYDDRLSDICEDSLSLLNFLTEIEDAFDIIIGMRETTELQTISDLVELIESKKK